MCMEPINNTFVTIVRYLHAKLCIKLIRMLIKMPTTKKDCVYFVFAMLGLIIERLASVVSHNRSSLAEVLD